MTTAIKIPFTLKPLRLWQWHEMALGKPDRKYLQSIVYPQLGARRGEVIVGPKFGVDNAVIRVGSRQVMIATADPLSFIPSLGPRDSAWLSVNLIASDLATSALAPQYGLFDFNLPPRMSNGLFARYWQHFHRECDKLGVAIVGGHTGRYEGCDYTVIGGGVMWATGREEAYLTSEMGRQGDDIILTKGAAIETTAVLARSFPKRVKRAIGANLFSKATDYLHVVTTVKDSLTAASVGLHQNGVTAMHDATEGGVIAAVFELAQASGLGADVVLSEVPISPETSEICKLFRIDPLTSLSEGSLIISCSPSRTGRLLSRIHNSGIRCKVIGTLTKKRRLRGIDSKGVARGLRYPKFDPYWRAYWKAIRRGWR